MDREILLQLLMERVDAEKFQLRGLDVHWMVEPTQEDLAAVSDVIASYEALAAVYVAGQMKQQAIDGVQAVLDSQAKELGFDSIHTAAVWTISKNEARKARADALVLWADSVWDFAEAEWEKQSKGASEFNTVEAFLKALPAFPGVTG